MFKIGAFSKLSKTTIKTLRFYEKEGLLFPRFIDENTGYRYYEADQLDQVVQILGYRKIGLSIKEIKAVLQTGEIDTILSERKKMLVAEIETHNKQLLEINRMMKELHMQQEIVQKTLPACTVYYKEGIVKDFDDMVGFILKSGEECLALNPTITCVEPDYCYINYLDGEYKEKDMLIRYAQAVVPSSEPFVESESIKFTSLPEATAICIQHRGDYGTLGTSYSKILHYIEEHHFTIADYPRECYIDGAWNKDNSQDYLTEIQIPISK